MRFDFIQGPFPGWNIALTWVVILVSTGVHLYFQRGQLSRGKVFETLLMYMLGIGSYSGMVGFFLHAFYADRMAAFIGWPAGNPFQTEVAVANLAFGVLGFLCFFRRDFWLPVIIARLIMGWGAGVTHLIDISRTGNTSVGNAGPIVWIDFIGPLLLVLVLAAWKSSARNE